MTTRKTITDGDRTANAELTNLSIHEASGVDEGDNPEAHVMLLKKKSSEGVMDRFKRWAGITMKDKNDKMSASTAMTTGQILAVQRFQDEFWKLRMAFVDSMYSIMEHASADEMGSMMAQSVAEFSAKATELAAMIKQEKRCELASIFADMSKALHDRETIDKARFVRAIEKLQDFDVENDVTMEPAGEGEAPTTKENNMSTKIDAAGTKTPAEKDDVKHQETSDKLDKILSRLEASEKRAEDAEKRAHAAEDRVARLEASAKDTLYVAKARKLAVPGRKIEDVAEALQKSYAVSEEVGKQVEGAFSAAAAIAVKGIQAITRIEGASSRSHPGDGTAHGDLMTKAAELRAADPKLSEARAYVKAMELNKGLASRAIANRH